MTAAEARKDYEKWQLDIETLVAELKHARAQATEASNLYGRLCREELRASQAKPVEGEKG